MDNDKPNDDNLGGEMVNVADNSVMFGDLDIYKESITSFKSQMQELVNEGFITKEVAMKLTMEAEYLFFTNYVKIN